MIGWLISLVSGASRTLWLYLGIAVAGAALVAWIFFSGKRAGEAAAKIEAMGEALDRASKAAKARAAVKHTKEAIDADPYNLDR